jgi:membrane-associated phospholipid phosphatase
MIDWPRVRRHARWWALAFVIALAWDRAVWLHVSLTFDTAPLRAVEARDWYKGLRILGSLQTWIVVALLLFLIDVRTAPGSGALGRDPLRRAVVLLLSTSLAGVLAELLKGVIGRVRPEEVDGEFRFFGLGERLHQWSNCGLPSSHAAVAFAAAFALGWMHRLTLPVFVALAIGCAFTRVLAGTHFLSDVLAGACVGYACASAIWRLDAANHAGAGIDRAIESAPSPPVSPAPAFTGGATP